MNTEHLYEEGTTAFLQVPKFVADIFDNYQVATIYALLREKRRDLVKKGLLKGYDQWFFYPPEWLQESLYKPNSPNHILKLLKLLKEKKLIDFRNENYYPFTRKFFIDDNMYRKLNEHYIKQIEDRRRVVFEEKREKEIRSEDDIMSDDQPLGRIGNNNFWER